MASISMNSRDLRWDPMLVVLLEIMRCKGSYMSHCMQRLTVPGGAKGAFGSWLPAYALSNIANLRVRGDVRGTFGSRPPARVPNSSPSQAMFKELTPMSMSESCTPGTVGHRLWPNKLDTTDSTSSQTTGAEYPMPGMAPPLSNGRKGLTI
jgi:hypothetical protein